MNADNTAGLFMLMTRGMSEDETRARLADLLTLTWNSACEAAKAAMLSERAKRSS